MARIDLCKCGHLDSAHSNVLDGLCTFCDCDCMEFQLDTIIRMPKQETIYCVVCNTETPWLPHKDSLCMFCRDMLGRMVEQVEDGVGMGAGAWDMVKPEEILAWAIKVARENKLLGDNERNTRINPVRYF